VNKELMEIQFCAPQMESIVFYMIRERRGSNEVRRRGDDDARDDWASLLSSMNDHVKHGEWIKFA
jgi:hypothetical protein